MSTGPKNADKYVVLALHRGRIRVYLNPTVWLAKHIFLWILTIVF